LIFDSYVRSPSGSAVFFPDVPCDWAELTISGFSDLYTHEPVRIQPEAAADTLSTSSWHTKMPITIAWQFICFSEYLMGNILDKPHHGSLNLHRAWTGRSHLAWTLCARCSAVAP
jgi:hypothetical protein